MLNAIKKKPRQNIEEVLCQQFWNQVSVMKQFKQFPSDFKIWHERNEQKCTPQQGARAKRIGVVAGIPDYSILFPGGYFAAIEFKRSSKAPLSDAQLSFKCWCEDNDIPFLLTWEVSKAISFITKLCVKHKAC